MIDLIIYRDLINYIFNMKIVLLFSLLILGVGCSHEIPSLQSKNTQIVDESSKIVPENKLNTSGTQQLIQPKQPTTQILKQTTEKPQINIAPKPEVPYKFECLNGTHMCGHECYPPCPDGKIFECSKFDGAEPSCKIPQQVTTPILTPSVSTPPPQNQLPFNTTSQNLRYLALTELNKCMDNTSKQLDAIITERNQIITRYNQTHEWRDGDVARIQQLRSDMDILRNKCDVFRGLISDTGQETIMIDWVSQYRDQAVIRATNGSKTYIYLSSNCSWLTIGSTINALRDGYALDGAGNDYLLSDTGATCKIIDSKTTN